VKDTTINSLVYHKMKKKIYSYQKFPSWEQGTCPSVWYETGVNNFYLRQDTVQKKVWSIAPNFSQEGLLYDFSKDNIGDTVKFVVGMNTYSLLVSSKDSLLLGDGKYHRRYYYGMSNGYAIEGVGYDRNLLMWGDQYGNVGGYGTYMTCMGRIVNQTYSVQNVWDGMYGNGSCSYQVLGENKTIDLQLNFSIYPNPASDFIFINVPDFELIHSQISVLNSLGEEVLTVENSNDVNVSDLDNGIYLMLLRTRSGSINKRFVISR
jgi:hypothetical protein